jgi:hypothetical protein
VYERAVNRVAYLQSRYRFPECIGQEFLQTQREEITMCLYLIHFKYRATVSQIHKSSPLEAALSPASRSWPDHA